MMVTVAPAECRKTSDIFQKVPQSSDADVVTEELREEITLAVSPR